MKARKSADVVCDWRLLAVAARDRRSEVNLMIVRLMRLDQFAGGVQAIRTRTPNWLWVEIPRRQGSHSLC